MPFSIQLKRKDGTIVSVLGLGPRQIPEQGQTFDCPVGNEIVKARVSAIRQKSVGADVGQPVSVVEAVEI